MIFAAQHPDNISHLIMVAGPHYVSVVPSDVREKKFRESRIREQESVQIRFDSAQQALESLRAPTSSYRSFDEEMLRHLVTYNMNQNRDGSLEWKWDTDAVAQTLSHIPDDLTPYIKRITCPILIPWGKRDQDLTPERVPIVKPLFPTARWELLDDVQYYIYLETPESLAKVIGEFLG
jgi:pimeloyl-ACP methyl ester carboxylesterase